MNGVVGQVGMAERAEYINMLTILQAKGLVKEDIVLAQLWIEQDEPSFAGFFPGGEDDFIVRFQLAAAIWAKEIVFFHG
jgi:hypothetical protein